MREAVLETPVDRPAIVAQALRPDHTDDMTTVVVDGMLRTEIRRASTGSLQATTDDYVVNLTVATQVDEIVDEHATENDTTDQPPTRHQ